MNPPKLPTRLKTLTLRPELRGVDATVVQYALQLARTTHGARWIAEALAEDRHPHSPDMVGVMDVAARVHRRLALTEAEGRARLHAARAAWRAAHGIPDTTGDD